jgi:hypothetical protein
MPLVIDSSTLAPSEVNANTKLYMQIWFRNLMTLLSLLVKRTSSFYGVAGRLGNITLPFSQHKENCGLILLNLANRSLIHIFALQNPQIVSISPQSHRVGVDASSFPNNCNASLPREGCACVVAYCIVCHSRRKWLFYSCGILDGSADFTNNCIITKRRLCTFCYLLYSLSFLMQTIISLLWHFRWPDRLYTLLGTPLSL